MTASKGQDLPPGPVVIDLEGPALTDPERELLSHPAVGGVILFSRNIENYPQLSALVAELRRQRPQLLLCVDQEGGRVQRCRDGFTRLPPMQVFDQLYRQDARQALELARDCGWLLASEILMVGLDFSFTPVLDVDDRHCQVIGDRSFSADADRVTLLAGAFIEGAREAGMAVTGKHFPGHGSVSADSHLELPVDERSLAEIQQRDMVPFADLGTVLDAVMPAHILFPRVDPLQPVGFSRRWLQDILRGQLGFEGLIFSDDLDMAGAAQVGSFTERARQALTAGCDMVLICNNPAAAREVVETLEPALYFSNLADRHRMRARQAVTREQLQAGERWRNTSVRMEQLLNNDAQ